MEAFQDLMSENHCYGCGPHNTAGLQIKSYWLNDQPNSGTAYCDFKPHTYHNAGMPHFLNGGVIATVMDCHAICTAIADGYAQEQRPIGHGEVVWYVTGKITVNYLKPAPIDRLCRFMVKIEKREGKKSYLSGELIVDETTYATADILAIRVPESWLRNSPPSNHSTNS